MLFDGGKEAAQEASKAREVCRGGKGRGIGREGTRQEKGERERRDSER